MTKKRCRYHHYEKGVCRDCGNRRRGHGEGGLQNIGGVWFINYHATRSDGSRKRVGKRIGRSRRAAVAALRKVLAEKDAGTLVVDGDTMRLEDLGLYYAEAQEQNGRRSVERTKRSFAQLKDWLGNPLVRSIDRAMLRRYRHNRVNEDKVAPATVHNELAALRGALNLAIAERKIPPRELNRELWRAIMPKFDNARKVHIPPDDLDRLCAKLTEHDGAWVVPAFRFACLVGWRANEVFGLEWDDVDWKRKKITLPADRTKEKRVRELTFGEWPTVLAILQAQREGSPWGLVFPAPGNKSGMGRYRTPWHEAIEALEWFEPPSPTGRCYAHYRFHDARHTAITDLLHAGLPIPTIAKITGASLQMLARYEATSDQHVDDAIRRAVNGGRLA